MDHIIQRKHFHHAANIIQSLLLLEDYSNPLIGKLLDSIFLDNETLFKEQSFNIFNMMKSYTIEFHDVANLLQSQGHCDEQVESNREKFELFEKMYLRNENDTIQDNRSY